MKGGFLESLSSTLSSWGSSISQSASDAYNKTKNAASSAYNSATTPSYTASSTPSYTASSTPSYTAPATNNTSYTPSGSYGGKKRKSKKMRGGYIPLTGLAANAAPISGIKTAEPHNWVGGKKSRKNKRRTRKN